MRIENIPFGVTNWDEIVPTEHPGVTGMAYWRTIEVGGLRVRKVEYTPGYLADHWCNKGHIVLLLEGELITELHNGETAVLRPGMSYQVQDDAPEPHRSRTEIGAKLFIVD